MEAAPQATLVAHTDTNLVTRAELKALPPVVGTDTFKPVAHIELVETLEKSLKKRDISIEREQFSTNGNGSKLFSVFDLSLNGIKGSCASLGLRTANDRTMSIQMIAGMRIFVCDNMCFNGDFIPLLRRHTSGLNLVEELDEAILKYEQHYRILKLEVDSLKAKALEDQEAKATIYDVFAKEIMPVRFLRAVGQEYFQPRHEEFEPRNAWSLHNAFTEVAKQMPLSTRMPATQDLGKYFGLLGNKEVIAYA